MADEYGTDAGFRTYHTARGSDVVAFTDPAIAAARLVASEWLDSRYKRSFPGLKVGQRSQIREWPRTGAIDSNGYVIVSDSIPTEVENATYEAALRQLISPGSLSVDWTPNKYRRASVDGAVSVDYREFSSAAEVQTQFAIIDEILSVITCADDSSPLSGGVCR